MLTRRFERPVPVQYRTETCWREVHAVAMIRLDDTYMVQILIALPEEQEHRQWVDRSRIRIDNPSSHR